jgi:hypothetical protein
MSLPNIFFVIVLVLIEFFLIGYFLPPILSTWKGRGSSIEGYLLDARSYIVKLCSFLCILFFVTAFILMFIAAYIQHPVGKNFISAISLILFGLFFSCVEGIVLYAGFSCAKRKMKNDVALNTDKPLLPSIFMLFFIGSTTLLSYPFVMIAQWIILLI